jgi:FdhD protein
MREIQVSRVDVTSQKLEIVRDFVAEETPLHIFLNKTHYATILCSPHQLKELAIGHVLSEGVLKSTDEIKKINFEKGGVCRVRLIPEIDAEKRISISQPFNRLIISSCGSPDYWPLPKIIDRLSLTKVKLGLTVEAKVVAKSVKQLNILAETFRKTGGVHVAALYSANGDLLTFSEDVGRHNAVDKVIGTGAAERLDFRKSFLALSGRLTGDIVLKAARMRIPVVASMTAAVNSGLEAAQLTGITLLGFVRGKRINIYAYPERIVYISQNLAPTGYSETD